MKDIIVCIAFFILLATPVIGQINIERGKIPSQNAERGYYIFDHLARIYRSEAPSKQKIDQLIQDDSLDMGSKTYRFATSMRVDVDFLQSASWVTRGNMTYGRLLIVASRAKSLSLNFNSFVIPSLSEFVIYQLEGYISGSDNLQRK